MRMSSGTCGTCHRKLSSIKQTIACIGPCEAYYHLSCVKIDPTERDFLIVNGDSTYKCNNCTRHMNSDVCVTPIPCHRSVPTMTQSPLCSKDETNYESLIIDKLNVLQERFDSAFLLIETLVDRTEKISEELSLLKNESSVFHDKMTNYFKCESHSRTVLNKSDTNISLSKSDTDLHTTNSKLPNFVLNEEEFMRVVNKKLSPVDLKGNKPAKKVLKIETKLISSISAIFLPKMKSMSMKNFGSDVNRNEELLKKMTVSKTFPWKLGSFLLLLAIAGLLSYDIRKHGSFQSSSTGRFLNDIGALQYAEHAWARTKFYSNESFRWAEENIPQYYEIVGEYVKPYLELAWDVFLVVGHQLCNMYENIRAYVEDKSPLVIEWVNYYAPGLLEEIKLHSIEVWGVVKENAALIWQYFLQYLHMAIEWAKTNVFVGNLSPENLQKYSMEALNTTQVYAVWTYDWVCQKVQTLSKIQ